MENKSKKFPKDSYSIERRKSALERLKIQLKKGTKVEKSSNLNEVPLTESDIKRMEKEIKILESRI